MNGPIFTKTPDGQDIVILSRADYDALTEEQNMLHEAQATYDALERGEEETLSFEEIEALRAAPTPLSFWRRKRQVTQTELAGHAGVPQGYVSDIENARKPGTPALLRKFADYLKITLDDLIP